MTALQVCVGSIEELHQLSGVLLTDLHRYAILWKVLVWNCLNFDMTGRTWTR